MSLCSRVVVAMLSLDGVIKRYHALRLLKTIGARDPDNGSTTIKNQIDRELHFFLLSTQLVNG
jgi:hypothetical protein